MDDVMEPAPGRNDYAYDTIEEYEAIAGFKVNEAFRMGWDMARTTNSMFRSPGRSKRGKIKTE